MNLKRLFLLFSFFCCLHISAQFTEISNQSGIVVSGVEGLYGNGLSLYDFNLDGLDDITLCTEGDGVHTFINTGSTFTEVYLIDFVEGDVKQATWVDFDNDHDPDFFCCIYEGSCQLFRNDNDGVFVNITDSLHLPIPNGKSFGAAWADYDRDGFLDVYIANYDFILPAATTNWLLHNNGHGAFEEVAQSVGVHNDARASFQPAWIDLNNDCFPELFVINDKYQGNALYANNAGVFTDISEEYNMDLSMESMSNSWSDFDNDLDYDVYISNSIEGNKLMRNDGDHFTDVAAESGVGVYSVSWSALWMDFDHNCEEDLHVATNSHVYNNNRNFLFRNQGNDTFYDVSISGDTKSVLATAMGDINDDGYIDFVELEQYPLGLKIYKNNGGLRHWLKLSLHGTISNSDGIGAKIITYQNGIASIKPTFCGEGFLTQNSQYEIVSLNNNDQIDSLLIQWPSGWIDTYYQIAANQFLSFTEGETFQIEILNLSGHDLCPGDSIVLSANASGVLQWNDGDTTTYKTITEPGVYTLQAVHNFGFTAVAEMVVSQFETPTIDWVTTHPACADSSTGRIELLVDSSDVAEILWETFEANEQLENLSSGIYAFQLTDINGCIQEGIIELIDPLPVSVDVVGAACEGELAEVLATASGGSGELVFEWGDLNPEAMMPGEYVVSIHDENNCITQFDFEIEAWPLPVLEAAVSQPTNAMNGSIDLLITHGTPPFDMLWNNKDQVKDIHDLGPGIYDCLVTDANGCQASFHAVLISTVIDENVQMPLIIANPFGERLVVQFDSAQPFCVMSAEGKMMYSCLAAADVFSIETALWPAGVYYLKSRDHTIKLVHHE